MLTIENHENQPDSSIPERKTKLQIELKKFFDLALSNPRFEAFFVFAMAGMEQHAGDQILGNINGKTPQDLISEIKSHADDEYRHHEQLFKLAVELEASVAEPRTPAEDQLLEKLKQVANSFVVGYFGNPLLTRLRDRHAAYVHGAVTIEQFPFQVYTVYFEQTKSAQAKKVLPAVIHDEHQHIALGRRMLKDLPEKMRVDLATLQEIERQMASLLFQRMRRILLEFADGDDGSVSYSDDDLFFKTLNQQEKSFCAWIQTLGMAEARAAEATNAYFDGLMKSSVGLTGSANAATATAASGVQKPAFLEQHLADEVRHQGMLHRSILLTRSQYRHDASYRKMEVEMHTAMQRYQNRIFGFLKRKRLAPELVYFYATSIIEARVFKHYSSLIQNCDDILVSYAVLGILDDEREHAQMFYDAMTRHADYSADLYRELKSLEYVHFYRMLGAAVATASAIDSHDEDVMAQISSDGRLEDHSFLTALASFKNKTADADQSSTQRSVRAQVMRGPTGLVSGGSSACQI